MSAIHPRWRPLLKWLNEKGMNTSEMLVEARATPGAGYGLFALKEIPPSTPLFNVPAEAMMNIRTLIGLYPKARPKLTATQIISLHLLLHRSSSPDGGSQDIVYGPYISILPSDFDAHPLTWLIKPRDPDVEYETLEIGHDLLEHIPKGVLGSLEAVAVRFREDWERVSRYLRDNPILTATAKTRGRKLQPLDSEATELEFLWGWLNVNTRCIYHRLCQTRSDPNNMTMCPILDFVNHTNHLPHAYPQASHSEVWDRAPSGSTGEDFVLLSPKDKTLRIGEEVFLKYGAHSNRTLFTEYGFINELDSDALEGQVECEADILWRALRFFAKRGSVGKWMEGLLRTEGYWGEWTIHSVPEPAHPSFRLITALRLYHSVPLEKISPPHDSHESEVRAWRGTIIGTQDMISVSNEAAWRETLDQLCLGIDNETGVNLDNLNKVGREWPVDSWVHYMRRCLLMLWREQQHAACSVHSSLQRGEQF